MNLLKQSLRKLVQKKSFWSQINLLSSFPNASMLKSVLIKDSDSECYAPKDNAMYDFFLKSTSGNIHKWLHYFEIYHMFFNGFRQKKNIRVMEIGVGKGGSLNLWRQYFDESAIIVGVDINQNAQRFENKEARTFVRIGDQANPKFLNKIADEFREFNIIIDDGGHTTNQQITSFIHLYDSLSKDGIYLVEDTHSNYWKKFQDRKDGLTFIDLAKDLVNLLHDPYQSMSIGYPLRVDNPNKLRELRVSKFYSETKSICFFDSIVVFTKGKRAFPKHEIR